MDENITKEPTAKKTTINDVLEVLEKFKQDNNNRVMLYGGLVLFDVEQEANKIVDNIHYAFGVKESLRVSLEAFDNDYKKDTADFIDWPLEPTK